MFKLLALLTMAVACVSAKVLPALLPYTSNGQDIGENYNGLVSPPVAATAVKREVTLDTRAPLPHPRSPYEQLYDISCIFTICYKTEAEVKANPVQGCSGIFEYDVSAWYPIRDGLKPYLCLEEYKNWFSWNWF